MTKNCIHYWKIEPASTSNNGKVKGHCIHCGKEEIFLDWRGLMDAENERLVSARVRGQLKRLEHYSEDNNIPESRLKCTLQRY